MPICEPPPWHDRHLSFWCILAKGGMNVFGGSEHEQGCGLALASERVLS